MLHQKSNYIFFLLAIIFLQPVSAQQIGQDSTGSMAWNEETYYQIKLLRLDRWLREHVDELTDATLLNEIVRLKQEAADFSQSGDFDMANIWLETIWELLPSEPNSTFVARDTSDREVVPRAVTGVSDRKFVWSREISSGVDFWRHEFNFGFFQEDSTFLEGSGNPSTSLRVNFDYGKSFENALRGHAFLKYSRDYVAGEGDLRLDYYLTKRSYWQVEDRFEINSFHRDFDLKYWQNTATVAFKMRESRKITFDVEDEFGLRRYAGEDSTYANYFSNRLKIFGRAYFGIGTVLGLGYRNHQRLHPAFDIKDYGEHRFQGSLVHSIGSRFSLSIDNEFRIRDYTRAPNDTTFQDYWEDYLYGTLTLGLSRSFGVDIRGSVTRREYDFFDTNSLPGYTFWEMNPELYLKIGESWKISAGVYYAEQTHEDILQRSSATDVSSLSIFFEDYYRYGPTLSLELFQTEGIILTLKESYLLERYPNSRTRNIDSFNLFSDRNINSLLLFMSWQVSSRWQFHAFANMDDDRSRKDDSGDSRSTIVGFEITYSF